MHTPRRIQMVFALQPQGEPLLTPEPINTCIAAMRGWGRVHTTRNARPSTQWGFKQGEIAIAVGAQGEQVAFRVGAEYRISVEMAENPHYQRYWSHQEKHGTPYLRQLIHKNSLNLWGLPMTPMGDWVDGSIIPFPVDSHRYCPTRAQLRDWYAFVRDVGMEIDLTRAKLRMQEIGTLGTRLKAEYSQQTGTVAELPPVDYRHASVTISHSDFVKMNGAIAYVLEQRSLVQSDRVPCLPRNWNLNPSMLER